MEGEKNQEPKYRIHEYMHYENSCLINEDAYLAHKKQRDIYWGKEPLCTNNVCKQSCSMKILDPEALVKKLCFFNTTSRCSKQSKTGYGPGYHSRSQKNQKNINETCLCTGTIYELDIFESLECLCYKKSFQYCLHVNDTKGDCNPQRKTCKHRIKPTFKRINALCEITDLLAINYEDEIFNATLTNKTTKFIYNETILPITTTTKRTTTTKTAIIEDPYAITTDNIYDGNFMKQEMWSLNSTPNTMMTPNLLLSFLILYFFFYLCCGIQHKAYLNKRKKK